MSGTPRKQGDRKGKQPHEKRCLRLTGVRVLHVTDEHFRFTHAGVEFWGDRAAFQGHEVDLKTRVLYLDPLKAHWVQPVGGRQVFGHPKHHVG
jgi:hypothetical protein